MSGDLWQDRFPTLAGGDDPALQRLRQRAQVLRLPAGRPVFHRGSACQRYLLVAEGRVRVYLTAANGREVVLYHVEAGQSCALTTACLLADERYPAAGITDRPTTALTLARPDFARALQASPRFQRFVFTNLGQRFAETIARIEQVHLRDIDSRLAASLLAHAGPDHTVTLTHQALAQEIGSAREVVSRHLKQLAGRGLIRLQRGRIELLDPGGLRRLA